jgi:hypothetical protein
VRANKLDATAMMERPKVRDHMDDIFEAKGFFR